jgi:hypothetical protein
VTAAAPAFAQSAPPSFTASNPPTFVPLFSAPGVGIGSAVVAGDVFADRVVSALGDSNAGLVLLDDGSFAVQPATELRLIIDFPLTSAGLNPEGVDFQLAAGAEVSILFMRDDGAYYVTDGQGNEGWVKLTNPADAEFPNLE